MSEAWRVASITHFEQVPVGTGALLRVAAMSTIAARPADERPTLVADDGYGVARFAALPAPPDDGGELRCAFSVPAELAAGATVFSLELPDGNVIALSAPAGAGPPATEWDAPAPEYDVSAEPDPYADEGSLTLGLLLDGAEARAELRAMQDLRALAPGRTARARVEPSRAPAADTAAELAELRVWSDELERRLAATTTELGEAHEELERFRASDGDGPGAAGAPDSPLSELREAGLREARRRAEHDLADATS